jgi:hypothetical protein
MRVDWKDKHSEQQWCGEAARREGSAGPRASTIHPLSMIYEESGT